MQQPAVDTIQQVLFEARNLLSIVTETPELEAEMLLAHVLHTSRTYLRAFCEARLNDDEVQAYTHCLMRRRKHEPIAYITGTREFWSLDLVVSKDTLVPRPETELLVQSVLDLYSHIPAIKIADLGTGSGAIALALAKEKPASQIYATDASESALQVARKNAQRLGFKNISFYQGNWCTALPCDKFDVIVSNPPYLGEMEWDAYAEGLAYEPRDALLSGLDGLDAIRTICHSAREYLTSGGYLLVEHGFLQGALVRKIFAALGYSQIHSVRDLSDNERVTIAQYK
jgi:release factor glutamine methyltransferase